MDQISISLIFFLFISQIDAFSASQSSGLRFPVQHAPKTKYRKSLASRHLNLVETPVLFNYDWGYFVNVSVGTPPQPQTLLISTDFGDTFFIETGIALCQDPQDQFSNCTHGTFDPSLSGTFQNLTGFPAFKDTYWSDSTINGYYFRDSIEIANTTVNNTILALATSMDFEFAIGEMGLGPPLTETYAASTRSTYLSLLDTLKASGVINSSSYSLWQNQSDINSGTLLLGGIDSNAFSGDLQVYPMLLSPSKALSWLALNLYSVRAWRNGQYIGTDVDYEGVAAQFTSDNYWTFLPKAMTDPIYAEFNVSMNATYGPIVDCGIDNPNISTYFNFDFQAADTVGGNTFSIPLSAFLEPLKFSNGTIAKFDNGSEICNFLIDQSTSEYLIYLGGQMMRYLYIAVDYDAQEIALGYPVNYTIPSLQEIGSNSSLPTCVGHTGYCVSTSTLSMTTSSTTLSAMTTTEFVTTTTVATVTVVSTSVPSATSTGGAESRKGYLGLKDGIWMGLMTFWVLI